VLVGAAIAVDDRGWKDRRIQSGAHGFSEILYALSRWRTTRQCLRRLLGQQAFYNSLLPCHVVRRFAFIVPVLAIAGSCQEEAH